MALNKRLLRKVRNRIAEIPESYDQSTWIDDSAKSPCGTTECLAGEIIISAAPSIEQGIKNLKIAVRRYGSADGHDTGVVKKARTLLGISLSEANSMFDGNADEWPEPYATRFGKAKRSTTKAKIAVAYLDECLKRGKVIW